MKHTTCWFPREYIKALDELVRLKHYPNRSEALRAAVRDFIKKEFQVHKLESLYDQIPKLNELILSGGIS